MQTLVEDFLQYLRHERGQEAIIFPTGCNWRASVLDSTFFATAWTENVG
jgi:hypothetical protein